ncbi:MAG TPA: hypothetical protein VIW01_11185 [Dehalococcoidia bacterium]
MTLERVWSYGLGAALIVAVLLPLAGDPRADSFPFSTYPMFSGRQSSETTIPHAIVTDSDGERSVLPPVAVANDEVVQAFETLRQAVRQGPEATARLCARAADWYAGRGEGPATVEIVSDTYNAVAYFEGDKQPVATEVHASCEVSR